MTNALKLGLAGVLCASTAIAGEIKPKDVSFVDGAVEQSLTGMPGDPEKGAMIVGEKSMGNCVACHQVSALADVPFQGEVGPPLDGAGDRWTEAELRGLVANAKMTFDGTVMPAFFKDDGYIRPGDAYTGKAPSGPLEPILSAQDVEDVVAFLMTQKEQ